MSTHNLTGSASFKFSLINTVRKAFKKDTSKDLLNGSTVSSASKGASSNKASAITKDPQSYEIKSTDMKSNPYLNARFRSNTFDNADPPSTASMPDTTESQVKSSKSKTNKHINKLDIFKKNELNFASKIGSMDNLNTKSNEINKNNKVKLLSDSKNFNFDKYNNPPKINSNNNNINNLNNDNLQQTNYLDKSCISTSSANSSMPEYDSNEYEFNNNEINKGSSFENKENFKDLSIK